MEDFTQKEVDRVISDFREGHTIEFIASTLSFSEHASERDVLEIIRNKLNEVMGK